MKSINLAATFAANFRPRRVTLSPRAFQLVSRSHTPHFRTHPRCFVTNVPDRAAGVQSGFELDDSAIQTSDDTVSDKVGSAVLDSDDAQVRRPAGRRANPPTDEASAQAEAGAGEVLSPQDWEKLEKELPDRFKHIMRTVANPLAIITSSRPDVDNWREATVGALVSSFCTVSMEPDVIVSFNLNTDSSTYRAILDSKQFSVTFPSNNRAGAKLAQVFTVGNHPPPFTRRRPQIESVGNADRPKHLQGYPPIVKLGPQNDADGTGIAFGLICEYQSSTTHGDHVIVTGRLLPQQIYTSYKDVWDMGPGMKSAFLTNEATLSYIHGQYAYPENGAGVDNCWKYDDAYLLNDIANFDPSSKSQAVKFYQQRLRMLGKASGKIPDRAHPVSSAHRLSPARVAQYEKYYEERLDFVLSSHADPEQLTGWQREFVRSKSTLTQKQLEAEQDLCGERVKKLQEERRHIRRKAHFKTENPEDVNINVQNADVTTVEDDSENPVSRIDELLRHFQLRLSLLQLAMKQQKEDLGKTETAPPNPQESLLMSDAYTSRAELKRFVQAQRGAATDSLKKLFRRYSSNEATAHLALIEAESRPDQQDETLIEQLRNRMDFYSLRREIIQLVMQERWARAGPEELDRKLNLRTRSQPNKNKAQKYSQATSHQPDHLSRQTTEDIDGLSVSEPQSFATKLPRRNAFRRLNLSEIAEEDAKDTKSSTTSEIDASYIPLDHIPAPDEEIDKISRHVLKDIPEAHVAGRLEQQVTAERGQNLSLDVKDPLVLKFGEDDEIPSIEGYIQLDQRKKNRSTDERAFHESVNS